MDSSNLTTCRITGITKTDANVAEFRLCSECGGYTHKTLGNPSRTKFDLTVDNAVVAHPFVEQSADNNMTREAYMCSHCGAYITNYEELESSAAAMLILHDAALEGTTNGKYLAGSKATLKTAIDAVGTRVTADASTQAQVLTAHATLNDAFITFEAGKVNYLPLTALAVSTQVVHNAALEGKTQGKYLAGSKATLQSAITAATDLVTAAASTQAQIVTAIGTLTTALATFEAGKVDYVPLTTLAVSAQAMHNNALEGVTSGKYAVGSKATFQTAIDAATSLVTAANSTEAQVLTATTTLNNAVLAFVAGLVA